MTGTILFLLAPNHGITLAGEPFQMSVSAALQQIGSTPAIAQRSYVRAVPDETGHTGSSASLAIGVTYPKGGTHTAIGPYPIPGTRDQMLGDFQLQPLIPDPIKGL